MASGLLARLYHMQVVYEAGKVNVMADLMKDAIAEIKRLQAVEEKLLTLTYSAGRAFFTNKKGTICDGDHVSFVGDDERNIARCLEGVICYRDGEWVIHTENNGTISVERNVIEDSIKVFEREEAQSERKNGAGLAVDVFEILEEGRKTWGRAAISLPQIVASMGVIFGDICREGRKFHPESSVLERELGNMIVCTIQWIHNRGLSVRKCVDAALTAQREARKELQG